MRKPETLETTARRCVLKGLCAVGIGTPMLTLADEAGDAALAPPAAGDVLVFAFGDRAGEPITPGDLTIGARQTFAFPMDPVTGTIRSGSRLNQAVVVRLEPETLAEATLERSVDGVVAYSGVCSHTGCDVTDWNADVSHFQCPCHESQFDPADGARVVGGPAPWQLAALPLALVDGRLTVADGFIGRVGFPPPGLDPFGL